MIAVEPVMYLYELLVQNIELNDLEETVKPMKIAVECRSGRILALGRPNMLSNPYSLKYQDTIFTAYSVSETVDSALTISFDDLIDEIGEVELVKMNCEGCEFPALNCADIKTLKKVKRFIIHTHLQYGSSEELRQILLKLKKADFHIRKIYKDYIDVVRI